MTHANGSDSEERLRATLSAAYPTTPPSEALRAQVATLAENAPPARPTPVRTARKPLRWGLAFAGATAIAVGVFLTRPTVVAAEMLQRMESRLRDVRSAYMVQRMLGPDGVRKTYGETWYQDGRWRLERDQPHQIQVFADGKLWSYDPGRKEVTVEQRSGPFAFNPSGLGFSSIVKDFTRWGWTKSVRVERTVQVDGHPAAWIAIEQNNSPERILLLVDRTTDLPLRMEAQLRKGAAWETAMNGEFRMNQPLSPALFEPKFPAEAKVIDRSAGKAEGQARLDRGMQRREVNDREIVLRDVQRNAQGDVFVMFTCGKLPGDAWSDHTIELVDEKGRRYERFRGTFQPYIHSPYPEQRTGFVVGDEKVEGALFLPTTPDTGNEERQVTLSIGVPTENMHGDPQRGQAMNIDPTGWARFTVKLPPPTPDLLPDSMRYTGVPVPEEELRKAHAEAQANAAKKP